MDCKRYLRVEEVSEITRLKPKTIREYCSRKLIPHIKLRGSVLFDPDDIDAWVQAAKVKVIRQLPLRDKEGF
jgi:excisionase family DNA binding protein